MAPQTYETTPTRFVEANGIRYAYRSLEKESGVPLVFLQHFRGTLDNWDPAVVNGLSSRSTTPGSLARVAKRPTMSPRWPTTPWRSSRRSD